jgi:hypothetical protein
MTGHELVALVGSKPTALALVLGLPLLVALASGVLHGRGRGGDAPWKYVYSVAIYATCIPGMLAAVLTAYTIFISRADLLDQNVLVYIVPLITMALTLAVIRRQVAFDAVPGFDRIWGLMTMIAMTFIIVLAITRTRIFLLFGGSMTTLIGLCAFVFALLKWGANIAFRGAHEPKVEPPRFGGA